MPQKPLELSLRETNGQLVIQWDPKAAVSAAYLEITESDGRTVLPVPPGSSSATYAARSGDVEILLSTSTGSGRVHWTSARFEPPAIVQTTRVPHAGPNPGRYEPTTEPGGVPARRPSRDGKPRWCSFQRADRLLGPVQ